MINSNIKMQKNKLVNAGLEEEQISQLLADPISDNTVNAICVLLEKTNYKYIKERNKKRCLK